MEEWGLRMKILWHVDPLLANDLEIQQLLLGNASANTQIQLIPQ
jgi:hypothetical protein